MFKYPTSLRDTPLFSGVDMHHLLPNVLPEQRASRYRQARRRARAVLLRRQAHQGGGHHGRPAECFQGKTNTRSIFYQYKTKNAVSPAPSK